MNKLQWNEISLSRIYRCGKAAITALLYLNMCWFCIEYKVTKWYLDSHCCQANTNVTSLSAPSNAWVWVIISCCIVHLWHSCSCNFYFKAAEAHGCYKHICNVACREKLQKTFTLQTEMSIALKEPTRNLCTFKKYLRAICLDHTVSFFSIYWIFIPESKAVVLSLLLGCRNNFIIKSSKWLSSIFIFF